MFHHGVGEEWKAQQAEAELEARIAEAEARTAYLDSLETPQSMEDPEVLEAARLEDERLAQQAYLDSLETPQTLEDPEVIAQGLAEDAAREEQKKKTALLDKLWALHKTAKHTRSQANTSAGYYRKHGVDNEQNDRKIAKMEATRDAAVALRDDVMASIATLSTGEGYRDDITVAELEGLIDKHRRAAVELDIDLQMEAEKARPDSSAGGAAAYTGTAAFVASLSAANGVASKAPVVGELYERHVGSEVRADLTRDASGKLGREMTEHAVASGEAIGKTGATVVQLANLTNAAVVADTVVHGTVEAVTGEDVASGNELNAAQRVMGVVGAASSGFSKLATLDPVTKMSKTIATMEEDHGGAHAPGPAREQHHHRKKGRPRRRPYGDGGHGAEPDQPRGRAGRRRARPRGGQRDRRLRGARSGPDAVCEGRRGPRRRARPTGCQGPQHRRDGPEGGRRHPHRRHRLLRHSGQGSRHHRPHQGCRGRHLRRAQGGQGHPQEDRRRRREGRHGGPRRGLSGQAHFD